jgi:hypothetical protein
MHLRTTKLELTLPVPTHGHTNRIKYHLLAGSQVYEAFLDLPDTTYPGKVRAQV